MPEIRAFEAHLELIRTFHVVAAYCTRRLARFHITPPQLGVLFLVARRPEGLPQGELRRLLPGSRPNLTALIERLVRAGCIARAIDPADRRRRVLRLTRKGQAVFARAWPVHFESMKTVLAPLSDAKRRALVTCLKKLRGPLEAAEA